MLLAGSPSEDVLAQDAMPELPPLDIRAGIIEAPPVYKSTPDTVIVTVALPECFTQLQENTILDEDSILAPVFDRLRLLRLGVQTDTLNILHIGDSHVRGCIFPNTAGECLAGIFGRVNYTNLGVNGATCLTFTHPDRLKAIEESRPDLLILSFGTNESHNRRYNANVHYRQIDELVTLIRHRLPDIPIILTTPPGSYESFRQRNRRRTYSINPRTVVAVDTICRYAREHHLAVWDMYNVLGGSERACKNWNEAKLMRPDHVHYLPEAYVLQGELLFEAIINAYNQYVVF